MFLKTDTMPVELISITGTTSSNESNGTLKQRITLCLSMSPFPLPNEISKLALKPLFVYFLNGELLGITSLRSGVVIATSVKYNPICETRI